MFCVGVAETSFRDSQGFLFHHLPNPAQHIDIQSKQRLENINEDFKKAEISSDADLQGKRHRLLNLFLEPGEYFIDCLFKTLVMKYPVNMFSDIFFSYSFHI